MTTPQWTEPGAYAVADGVHRIPLPLPMDGLRAVNVYVLETDDGLTCIDGGWAIEVARKQLEGSLRSVGQHPRDITSFLVTHAHRDHYTQASALRTEFGRATVALGSGERPAFDLLNDGTTVDPFGSRLRAGGAFELAKAWGEWAATHGLDASNWQPPDQWIENDQAVVVGDRTLHAIATPGHTAGHYVFADLDAGLLFAGDHVLPTITPSIGFEAPPAGQPLHDFLESLAKVRRLPDLRLLPAHGDTDRRSHDRVDELVAHHDQRLELCLAAVAAGHDTAYEVAVELPWTRHHRRFADLDSFNAGMAVLETLVHLDLLWSRGQLTRRADEDTYFYDATSRG